MKKEYLIIGISLLALIVIGLFLFKNNRNNGPKATPTPTPEEKTIEKLPADSLDVTLTPRADNRAITIVINGLKEKGYTQFEYELTYDAQSTEDPSQTISQGSGSTEPIKVTDESFKREILFGTCSKNICKYDIGVKNIKFVIRLTDSEGKTKIWQKDVTLE